MARRERSGSPKNQPLGEDSIRLRADAHPSRYPWPKRLAALLGRTTDAALAKRAGLSRRTVEAERRRRGIPAFTEKRPPVKWTRRLITMLGTAPDWDIAKEMGVNAHTVNMKRRMLGIEPYGRPNPTTYEWTERGLALLGRKSDTEVGRALGISRNTVRVKRRELGIAARGKGPVRWTRAMKAYLGKMPDKEVGRRFGISDSAVAAERTHLGIRPHGWRRFPIARGPQLKALLKTHSATELLQRYGMSYTTVKQLRAELGVPAPPRRSDRDIRREGPYWWTEKEKALLGKLSDKEVGERVGVSRGAAKARRLALGIPAVPRSDYHRWNARELALLGKLPDGDVAASLGVSIKAVRLRRLREGILCV